MPTTGKELFPSDRGCLPSMRSLKVEDLLVSFLVDGFGRADFLEAAFLLTDRSAERGPALALLLLDFVAGDAGFFRFMSAASRAEPGGVSGQY